MKVKVLNIMTGGMFRDGICTTQLELYKVFDMSEIEIHLAAVHNNEDSMIDDFRKIGCNVIVMPDRKERLCSYIKELHKLLKNEKYDIIHVHGSSAIMSIELLVAKICGVKTRIAHSRNTKCENIRIDKLLRPLFNILYTKALACGKEAGEWLFQKNDFIIVHNGKDLTKFKYSQNSRELFRKLYNIPNDVMAIGCVGNISKVKNQTFLLDVIKETLEQRENIKLFIIGDGPERSEIESKVKDLGLDDYVIFTGRVDNVHEYVQAMDLMCLPSLYEGLPNVVLEWQISGLYSVISENITSECAVTDSVIFLPIDKGTKAWIDYIVSFNKYYNRSEKSECACIAMKEAGFDILDNASYICEMYKNSI